MQASSAAAAKLPEAFCQPAATQPFCQPFRLAAADERSCRLWEVGAALVLLRSSWLLRDRIERPSQWRLNPRLHMPSNANSTKTADYSKLKVTELRAELKKLGLDMKGRKSELIERLEQGHQQVSYSAAVGFLVTAALGCVTHLPDRDRALRSRPSQIPK